MTAQPADASDLVDRLVRSGLGHGEARCYVGMLAPRAFRVGEVAKRAGLPRSRCYELIRSLVRAGLCTEVASSGAARFRAVPPNEAIGRLEALAGEQARLDQAVVLARTFGWTQGYLAATGWLDWLSGLDLEVRATLPDGTRLLGVHAAPGERAPRRGRRRRRGWSTGPGAPAPASSPGRPRRRRRRG